MVSSPLNSCIIQGPPIENEPNEITRYTEKRNRKLIQLMSASRDGWLLLPHKLVSMLYQLVRIVGKSLPVNKNLLRLQSIVWYRMPRLGLPEVQLVQTSQKMVFALNPNNQLHMSVIYSGVYDPEKTDTLSRLLKPGDVAFDIGANFGWYTILFSKIVSLDGCVVAFEPVPSTFETLSRNIRLNRCRNTRLLNVALGDSKGMTLVHTFSGLHDGHASLSNLSRSDAQSQQIRMQTMDDVVDSIKRNPDLIKMDVEGAERIVLLGAKNTIARSKPIILIEINPQKTKMFHEGYDCREILSFIREFGYSFFRIKKGGVLQRLKHDETIRGVEDLLCIPFDRFAERISNSGLMVR